MENREENRVENKEEKELIGKKSAPLGLKIDYSKCDGCGDCTDSCAKGILVMTNDVLTVVNGINCNQCGKCLEACIVRAISLNS